MVMKVKGEEGNAVDVFGGVGGGLAFVERGNLFSLRGGKWKRWLPLLLLLLAVAMPRQSGPAAVRLVA